jgi:TetR/AcrR family transcriptional repressor of bet genes
VPKLVDHERRRDEVAAVAAAVLADTGIDSSTIRDVATAGGWSTTRVTHYFASKDELLAHTLEHSITESTAAIVAAYRAGSDELRAIVEQLLPLDDERRGRWRLWLAFWGRAIGSSELAEIQRSRQSQLVAMFDDALARRGEPVDPDERRAEAQRLIALLDGVAVQAIFHREQWPPERQLGYFADVLDR